MSCNDQPPYLKQLVLKMFAITPHSTSCERMFSALGWYYGKKRTTLDINTVKSMAKIRHYYQNNSKHDTSEKIQTDNEVQKFVDESFFLKMRMIVMMRIMKEVMKNYLNLRYQVMKFMCLLKIMLI